MVAKINVGTSLYGALAYNGEKVNEGEGKLLATNRIFDDGTGQLNIRQAAEDFGRFMPDDVRTRNKVIHISLNPHPQDLLNDAEMKAIAEEYMERLGYGNQPYAIFKHEDIDRHHLHIVSINVDENGRRINKDFLHRRSKRITRELEQKYGLHPAERKRQSKDLPLKKVDISQGDVKRQVGNVLKALSGKYHFQTLGEYRALLSLYNVTVEDVRGNVNGREYQGFVYSATDDDGGKVGNPLKASRFGKRYGYDAFERWSTASRQQIKDGKLHLKTRVTALSILGKTNDRNVFVNELKRQGIDVVFRETDTGRIYGTTFIDHRTGCVLNGSRLGKELSANALQSHFTQTAATQGIIQHPAQDMQGQYAYSEQLQPGEGLGLFTPEGPAVDVEEERFIREMQKKKKKKRKGFRL